MYHRHMRHLMTRLLLVLIVVFQLPGEASAWRKWEHVNPADLDIRIVPDQAEVIAGETATFTIVVRNRTDKPVSIDFATGQRWDLAIFHGTMQIWRYSNGMSWEESPHSISIHPDRPETFKLSWTSIDRVGMPLAQDVYRAQAMVMCSPRFMVSNMCQFRLLPPKNTGPGITKVQVGKHFEIVLPRFLDNVEVDWRPDYDYNDNRVSEVEHRQTAQDTIFTFRADRPGHVNMHVYGYVPFRGQMRSKERRSYRIEVFFNE